MEPLLDIVERDSLVDALQSQVAFYKNECENLKLETRTLINENSELSRQLDLQIRKNAELQNLHVSQESIRETLETLRKQLALTEKEKDSFESLWKTSQGTVNNLENELKAYQTVKRTQTLYGDNDEIKHEYSSIVKMLESKLSGVSEELKVKDEKIEGFAAERESLKKRLQEKETIITDSSETRSELNLKILNLEKEVVRLKSELAVCKTNYEELMSKMELCRQNFDACTRKEMESRNKIVEALSLVDIAVQERDDALQKLKGSNAESTRLSNQVTEVLNESSSRIQKELDIAKQTYNEKLNDMLIHIQRLELELGEKNLSLERLQRECTLFEERIKREKQCPSIEKDDKYEKLLVLEQKLEATFQQLLLSERRNIQIISEKENLQMDHDQMKSNYQREKKKREWEEKLQMNEMNSLRIQIGNLKDALGEAHHSIQCLQRQIFSKDDIEEKLTNDKYVIAKEFEKYFETQHKINTKWKQNMKEIILKLEYKIEVLMNQIKTLKNENSKLIMKNK